LYGSSASTARADAPELQSPSVVFLGGETFNARFLDYARLVRWLDD
jgi:hypothetical protein